jgi:hypothetical protein
MFYEQDTEQVWVFYGLSGGTWEVYQGLKNQPPVAMPGVTAPPGLYVPDRGFGRVWYLNNLVGKLGWSTQPNEITSALGAAEFFERGMMLDNPTEAHDALGGKRVFLLYNDGSFANIPDHFPDK